MLSPEQLSSLRTELLREEQDLRERMEENNHYDLDKAMIKESLGELSSYDNHPADHGSELFERQKDIALNEHAEEHLQDVQAALNAIEQGAYGSCEICSKAIPYERLQALPTATRCMEHSPNKTVSQDRPIEEEVLDPPFGQFDFDEQDTTMYDAEDAWQDVARYGSSDTPSDFFDQKKTDYNEMFLESDEPIGFTEAVEEFLMADLEGNFIGIAQSPVHDAYEDELDDEGIISITGGFGHPMWDYDQQ
ncbi:hypothetical protein BEP19_03895 [Ammoniphilus oxalaticus]|uniref:Zinc finger DksA/TraR C4-type domain-containing protein n=1 Tax=Ammoniphilus oxalaticus TaxID=66863 RepID=A0A419SLN9_9BACL|nr:TraR/DksA C4-type zinc finger protein [Ammoniphilus oxalaticus]RKD24987.1 hypothetical protein BEP19_03895 [Ammoniphilus oxalaticus]